LFSIVAFKTLTFHTAVYRHTWRADGISSDSTVTNLSWFWQ